MSQEYTCLADEAPNGHVLPIGRATCRVGHIATIHPGKDFYISLGNHDDWSSSHTVWGRVHEMQTVLNIIAMPFREIRHQTYGTAMRMLVNRVPFDLDLGACPM
jgi:hypothetical protein